MKDESEASHGLTVQCRTNGILNGEWRYATPAEVAEAHPKCGTCDLMRIGPHVTSEPYCRYRAAVDPALDYCRHHSELNKETT